MLKHTKTEKDLLEKAQPPSGGCVLKHIIRLDFDNGRYPAAFRRLCVETLYGLKGMPFFTPAAFRRLCVETRYARLAQEA